MGQSYELYENDQEVDRFEVRDLRVKTRFAIDNIFYDEYAVIFGPTISMVYIALVRHANKEQKTWPSQKRIAEHLGISRQWVGTHLKVLQFFNLIRSVRLGKTCNNRYYLIDEKQWRTDFEAMSQHVELELSALKQLKQNQVMSPQVTSPIGDIRCLEKLHHMLLKVTSNSKDKQERINNKDSKKVTIKKTDTAKIIENPKHIAVGQGSKSTTKFNVQKQAYITYYHD